MAIIVGDYQNHHFAGVDALWNRCLPDCSLGNTAEETTLGKLGGQPQVFLVATEGRVVIGTVMAGYDGHIGRLYPLAVDLHYRWHRVATRLVQEAEARLRSLGCTHVNLPIRGSNADLSEFYASLGYAIEDCTRMTKSL